jgi:hypothetical protein
MPKRVLEIGTDRDTSRRAGDAGMEVFTVERIEELLRSRAGDFATWA